MSASLQISIFARSDGPIERGWPGGLVDILPVEQDRAGVRRDVVILAGGEGTVVPVPPGRYLVQATLPSGELLENSTDVDDGETKQVRLAADTRAYKRLNWHLVPGVQPRQWPLAGQPSNTIDRPRVSIMTEYPHGPEGWEMERWITPYLAAGDALVPTRSDGRISLYEFKGTRVANRVAVRRGTRVDYMTLPTPWGYQEPATIQLAVPYDPALPPSLAILDRRFGPLLGFVATGALTRAYKMLGLEADEESPRWLAGANENPSAAMLASYLLVTQASEHGPHHWYPQIQTFAETFEKLADGPVLQGWLCMLQGRPYAEWFYEAYIRGVPVLTGTLRMLYDGLLTIDPKDFPPLFNRWCDAARSQVGKFLAYVDPAQPFVTLRSSTRKER